MKFDKHFLQYYLSIPVKNYVQKHYNQEIPAHMQALMEKISLKEMSEWLL